MSLKGRRIVAVHPSSDLYGSDRVFADAVQAFRDGGATVTVVLPTGGPLEDVLAEGGQRPSKLDFPVLRKALLSFGGLSDLLWSAPSTVRRLVRFLRATRPDVLYVSTITVPHWLLAARVAGVGSVCHVHELEPGLPKTLSLGLLSPLRLASRIVVNSQATRNFVEERLSSLRGRSVLAYNGFRFDAVSDPPTFAPQSRLALVGRLSPRKGQDLAIDALSRVIAMGHDVTLELVGDTYAGYEWYELELRAQAERLGVKGQVLFTGFSPNPASSYAASDIVLVPSRLEPFGNVAAEGSAWGRPVIAAAVGGLPEIVEDGVTGSLVPPDSPQELALAIHRMLEAPHWAASLGARGSSVVRKRFSIEQFAGALVEVVAQTVQEGDEQRRCGVASLDGCPSERLSSTQVNRRFGRKDLKCVK